MYCINVQVLNIIKYMFGRNVIFSRYDSSYFLQFKLFFYLDEVCVEQ